MVPICAALATLRAVAASLFFFLFFLSPFFLLVDQKNDASSERANTNTFVTSAHARFAGGGWQRSNMLLLAASAKL